MDNVVEGQRYLQWALGYPQEQKGMSKAVGETGILVVRPGLTLSGFVMFVPAVGSRSLACFQTGLILAATSPT